MDEQNIGILKNRTIKSVFALTTRTFLLQIISLFSFSLLTYFLAPSAIGVLIAATASMKFFTLFTDIGFGASLIQKKEALNEEDLKTTFTLQMILVISIVCIGLFISSSIGTYFGLTNEGIWLLRVLIIILFISSLKTIPSILLEREIKFEKQILPQIVEAVIYNVLVVILAVKGFGVASFSWSFLISALSSLPIYYYLAPWKIGFGINKQVARRILFFGTPYQLKSILGVFKDDLIMLYATKTIGLQGVGYLGWSQKWAFSPFRFLVDSITKVTFPAFSRIQEEKTILTKALERSLFAVSLIMFPVMGGLVIIAKYFVLLIPKYSKWEMALPMLYFFSLNAAVSSLSNILINVLDATGRVKTTLILMVFWTILTWILTPIGILIWGVTGLAVVSAGITFTIVITVFLVNKIIRFDFIQSVWKPLVITLLMVSIITIERYVLGITVFSLISVIGTGLGLYVCGIWIIAKSELKELLTIIEYKNIFIRKKVAKKEIV